MIHWRRVALSVVVLLGVSVGCGGREEPAAKAPPPARYAPATEAQAAPQIDPQQMADYLADFSWDPGEGAERDKAADSDECREQIGELSSRFMKALVQIRKHIDCMEAKGWNYRG